MERKDECAAVVLMEVLEHLVDPLGSLRQLLALFPRSVILASVPSPFRIRAVQGRREAWDWPPNHLTRFTPEGLFQLFKRAGATCSVTLAKPSANDSIPCWWSRLPMETAKRVKNYSDRKRGHSPHFRFRSAQDTLVPLGLLWGNWVHAALGGGLGWSVKQHRAAGGFSGTSMLAVAAATVPNPGESI
jgi:hypothetical protein